jgi:hypothetical protein
VNSPSETKAELLYAMRKIRKILRERAGKVDRLDPMVIAETLGAIRYWAVDHWESEKKDVAT